MMHFSLDFRSGQPIYIQIVEQVRQMVNMGLLKQGDQLPTVRQLATDLRVNFNTIARAYRLLDDAGLISTQQGRGTYIWQTPTAETLDRLRQEELEDLTRRFMTDAARLGSTPEEIRECLETWLEKMKNGEIDRRQHDDE